MYCAMVLSSTQCTDVEWIKEHAGFSQHIRVISLLEYYWGWTSYLQLLKTALFLLTLLIFLRMKDSFLFHIIPSYFISYTRTTHRSIHDLMFISRSMGVGAEDTGKHESKLLHLTWYLLRDGSQCSTMHEYGMNEHAGFSEHVHVLSLLE